jgi:hypothetical protein
MLTKADNFFNPSREFDVATEDLSDLEIRDTYKPLHYFYDRKRQNGRALVTDFILADKKRTAIMCRVTLVKRDDGCSPRLRF